MSQFSKESYDINGIETVVYTAGSGEPLVFFHGAGTVDGFDFALPLAETFRVILPYHPGFGESADDPSVDEMHDYVMHYLELFDALELKTFNLVGLSLGGYLAAKFGVEHGHRIRKLGMIAPALMVDPEHPLTDILAMDGQELIAALVKNFDVLAPHLPESPGIDFIADRYRETTSLARIQWEHPNDLKLPRYLHRLTMPTMIVWGEEDRIVPVAQAEAWKKALPDVTVTIVPDAGHLVHLEKPEVVTALGEFLGA
jgi:pimeloyl-ACP methyl ester carboxylesterase